MMADIKAWNRDDYEIDKNKSNGSNINAVNNAVNRRLPGQNAADPGGLPL